MTDREILRALAGQWQEIAQRPEMTERKSRYRALNRGERVQPPVLIHELPWNQLAAYEELTNQCEDEFLRGVETNMRRTLFQWKYFPGDMIVLPRYDLPRRIFISPICPPIVEETAAFDRTNHIVSHHYEDQLAELGSESRLRPSEIRVDDAGSARDRERLDALFGDLLPIRLAGCFPGNFMPWDDFSMLRGVEPILMDLSERPEHLHALVGRYTELALQRLSELESRGLIDEEPSVYLHCTCGLTDDLPGVLTNGRATRKNLWGRGTAQMFSAVSPRMHDEFDIEYEKRYFEGFPRVYYGCCEPLDRKIEIVRRIPHVRKISITPWADVRVAAERMGRDFVMAWKPNPASVAVPVLNESALRAEIGAALDACRQFEVPMEMTLKDISSIHYNLENLVAWERIAMEMARGAR